MTGKMVSGLVVVGLVAAGLGGVAGWLIGRGSADNTNPHNSIISVVEGHDTFAEACRQKGALVDVAVTKIEFDAESHPDAPRVTDATLAEIVRQHPQSTMSIRRLALKGAQITDAALAELPEKFDFLELLDLTNCKGITDAGLEHLKRMTTLETLILSGCDGVTKNGVNGLVTHFKEKVFGRKDLRVTFRQ